MGTDSMSEAAWYDLGPLDEFPPDEIRGAMISGQRLCVGRSGDGLFAVDDTCPHAGGSLSEGLLDGDLLICPLHAYAFQIKTGHCPDDPSCSVRSYEVRVEGGVVQVRI